MDALEAIFKRRSIRKYKNKIIPEETIKDIIKAGMSAPSAGNEQPWDFIILDDRKLLNDITLVHPYSQMLKLAPLAILVCGDLNKEIHKDFWIQDCSAATENILIAVAAKGLGAVWLGIFPREDRIIGVRKILNIPEHVIPFSLIPIGFPDEEKIPKSNFDFSCIHHNKW